MVCKIFVVGFLSLISESKRVLLTLFFPCIDASRTQDGAI